MTQSPRTGAGKSDPGRFSNLTFEDFRERAGDPNLSKFEKIGFPDAFRDGCDPVIFADILSKMENLGQRGRSVLDIGPGCSDLPSLLIDHCSAHDQKLFLMDSPEMLILLPEGPTTTKVPGRFPDQKADLPSELAQAGFDVVLVYSVLQHVFIEANPFSFLDNLLELLKPGGELLVGDIPNVSKLRRFLASDAGIAYHKTYMDTDAPPEIDAHNIDHSRITDAVIIGLVERARAAGFDAFILPQPAHLPMSNRREDLYIRRP